MAEIGIGTKVRITNGGIWQGYTGEVVKISPTAFLVALDGASGNDVPVRPWCHINDFEVVD